MTISPARPDELAAAFALLYGPNAGDRVAHAQQLVARGELNPIHILVARTNRGVSGAVFCQALPGGIAVIWPPRSVGDDPSVEDALAAAALARVTGVKVVQAFLPSERSAWAGPLLRAGFRRVTRVLQMTATPRSARGSRSAAASRLSTVSFPLCDPAEFERALIRAHDDSLDCPELHGVRTPAEVLAGYRDCAPDLTRWWLARVDEAPAGVLILGPSDLAFVGVVPEQRGQGIGRALVEHAVTVQLALSLIVDARNEPAIRVYQALGFESVGAREVFLLIQ
jgi:ribosomal protein S18 acetylase RimI-like enzyme